MSAANTEEIRGVMSFNRNLRVNCDIRPCPPAHPQKEQTMVANSKKAATKQSRVKMNRLKLNKETVKDLRNQEEKVIRGGLSIKSPATKTLPPTLPTGGPSGALAAC